MGYCQLLELGRVSYIQSWNLQKQLQQRLLEDPEQPDHLLIVEHPPVYTLGTGSTLEYVNFDVEDPDVEWYRTERGGEVTYHCPGQIVAYPIFNLRRYHMDLHWYLRQLEAAVILALESLGVKGERMPGLTGVWVDGCKVAAIGIKVRRWVTMHGLALNVCPNLSGFQKIVPCGISDRPVGSVEQFLPGIQMDLVQSELIQAFETVFQFTLIRDPQGALLSRSMALLPFKNGRAPTQSSAKPCRGN